MPGGRIATSPYTTQCVAKLRVVRLDSGPLPILLLVNFLVTPETRTDGGSREQHFVFLCTADNFLVGDELQVDQYNQPFFDPCLRPTPLLPQPSSPPCPFSYLKKWSIRLSTPSLNWPSQSPRCICRHVPWSQDRGFTEPNTTCSVQSSFTLPEVTVFRLPACGNGNLGPTRMDRYSMLHTSHWNASDQTNFAISLLVCRRSGT